MAELSTKPYLIRALYEWCVDSGYTPQIMVVVDAHTRVPPGFVKVRHFGFLSPNFGVPLQRIRELICVLYEILRGRVPKAEPPRKPKPLACGRCGALMVWRRFFPPMRARAAPA